MIGISSNCDLINDDCTSVNNLVMSAKSELIHDDVIRWKHFPRYWPFVRGIHRSLVNSPHNDQWRGALIFSLICVWINGWVNNREAGDLRSYRAHYDVIVMFMPGGRGGSRRRLSKHTDLTPLFSYNHYNYIFYLFYFQDISVLQIVGFHLLKTFRY